MPPYRTVVVPLAFVAAMPPRVASAPGSTGNQRPCGPAAASTCERVTPACTVTARSSAASATIELIRVRSRLIPPSSGMTWPSRLVPVADDLARCLGDAEACAEACERLLEAAKESDEAELQQRLVDTLAAPAAVARVLSDLIEEPPGLVLAAARLCRDRGQEAIAQLEA